MPARAAASAHWVLRWSVGVTMVTRSMTRRERSSAAIASAKEIWEGLPDDSSGDDE